MNKKPLIALIDTGTSNIKSVYYALTESNAEVLQIKKPSDLNKKIDAMVVPGIGSFNYVMRKLKSENLDKFISEKINSQIPSLFICVGMQISFDKRNEYAIHKCLELFENEVKKINEKIGSEDKRKIPFIGWNKLIINKKCKVLEGISENDFFYFTHSFYVDPLNKDIISTTTNYDNFSYCSSVSHKNVFATQFHPEKSGVSGLKIYQNFIRLI